MPSKELRLQFQHAREDLQKALIERDAEIDICLYAMLCNEHVLFVGAPGMAKSLLIDSLTSWIKGAKKFATLITRTLAPEDVFGIINISDMKAGKYRRVIDNMLPDSHLVFADEIWNGSGALLNNFLGILNERKYRNGTDGYIECPLRLFMAASNHYPTGMQNAEELSALFDRFLFRKTVKYITRPDNMRKYLTEPLSARKVTFRKQLTLEGLDYASKEAMDTPWSDQGNESYLELIKTLSSQGIQPSDRRRLKARKAAAAAAWLAGSEQVLPEHLEATKYCLWDTPGDQEGKTAEIVAKIANPAMHAVVGHLAEADRIMVEVFEATKSEQLTQGASRLRAILTKLNTLRSTDQVEAAKKQVQENIKDLKLRALDLE